ncbi:DUF4333 domain-containing protein [Mycolicibacterium wolinskyi]|uniref:DUF4333 domain-containing protein n=1 Tax=Mycolicibacterium wolinskyi TaxID=59750 RepID=UPI003917B409
MTSAGPSRPALFVAALVVGVALSSVPGCSVTVGGKSTPGDATPKIPQAELESGVKKAITEKTGAPIESVSCDGPLEGIVGATERCIASFATKDGLRAGVTVTTTSVDESDIKYDFKVDDKPAG